MARNTESAPFCLQCSMNDISVTSEHRLQEWVGFVPWNHPNVWEIHEHLGFSSTIWAVINCHYAFKYVCPTEAAAKELLGDIEGLIAKMKAQVLG